MDNEHAAALVPELRKTNALLKPVVEAVEVGDM